MCDANGAPALGEGCSYLHGPVNHGCAFITLERHPRLSLLRIRVDGRKPGFTDETLREMLATMEGLIERGLPVTVTYDLRTISLPNPRQVRAGVAWCGAHKAQLDEQIQGITVILSSYIVAKMANLVLAILKPPQPTKICRDEAEAVDFLAAVKGARSWAPAAAEATSPPIYAASPPTIGAY